ncbi:hypothetical protein JCM11641_007392 [Rhodosporidiobolus odoratus]
MVQPSQSLDFSSQGADSQFTQTQPATQQYNSQQSAPLPTYWGLLVPVAGPSSSTLVTGKPPPPALELDRRKTVYLVGRHPKKCDLILPGGKVSTEHARIVLSDDGLVRLYDTSTNGTFVGGNKVGKGNVTILENGVSILFGPANLDEEFRYVFQTAAGKARPDPYGLGDLLDDRCGIHEEYEVREQLGKGSFATVRKGVKRSNGQMVAIKIIAKARFSSNPQTMQMFQREIAIAKQLNHEYCVKCYDFYESRDRIWLVLEYVDGGDLLDYVMKRGGLKENETREIALMVCQAVAYLHSRGITHRDLKPENLLLTKGKSPRCKVTDFGLAKMVNDQTMLKTMCGTPTYLAPEVINQTHPGLGYKSIVDAYSIGVILYSCLTNQTPFDESETTPLPQRMQARSVDLNIPREMGVSEVALDFLDRFLQNDPALRMTCSEALQHEWLRMQDGSSVESLPFSFSSQLPFNNVNGEVDGDLSTLQSAASLTSPAMSSRVRDDGEDSMIDSQGFGNLRIDHSTASMTTAETSAPVSKTGAVPPLSAVPESTEQVTDFGLSPHIAGQKRKAMESRFSDSSLSELTNSQLSQHQPAPAAAADPEPNAAALDLEKANGAESVAEMSGLEEEKVQGKEESEDREPSTTEETDVVSGEVIKLAASPRATRRTSRGGAAGAKKDTTPAHGARGRGRASSGATSVVSEAASASPDPAAEGGIAASVKNRRRKAARLG